MSESFSAEIQQRAYQAMRKLHPDQLEHLETLLYGRRGLDIENAYHTLTGHLLEPVIARYWIDCKKIPLHDKRPLQSVQGF